MNNENKYILNIIKNGKIRKTYKNITEHMVRVFNLAKNKIPDSEQIDLEFDSKLASELARKRPLPYSEQIDLELEFGSELESKRFYSERQRFYVFSKLKVEDIIYLIDAYFDKKVYEFDDYFIFSNALYYLQSPVPAEYLFEFLPDNGKKYHVKELNDTLVEISELPKLKSRYIAVECIIKSLVLKNDCRLDKVIAEINVDPKVSRDMYPLFYWCQIMKEHKWCQHLGDENEHPHVLLRHYREIYDSDKHSAAYFLYFLGENEHTVLMQNKDFFTNATYYNIHFDILKTASSKLLGKYLAQIDNTNLPKINSIEYNKLSSYLQNCPLLYKQRILARYEFELNKKIIKIIDNILDTCPAQEIESDFLNGPNFRNYISKTRTLLANIYICYLDIFNKLSIRINLKKLVIDKFFFEKLSKIDKSTTKLKKKESNILFVKFGVKNEITRNFNSSCVKIDQYLDYNYFEINIKDVDPSKITKIGVKDNYIILEPYGCAQILPDTCYSMCVSKKGITLAYFTDGDTEIICAITTLEIGIFNTPGMFEYIIDFDSLLYSIIMNCSEFEIRAD